MAEETPSAQVRGWLAGVRADDREAADALVRHVAERMHELTRRMLRNYPTVRRWAETDDVLQAALIRLLRAVRAVPAAAIRDVLGLAAEQVRRELIDLARHFHGPQGSGRRHATPAVGAAFPEPADESHDPTDLTDWTALHEQVGQLPEEEREVVGLLFYQGLSQVEAAALLGVAVRTVQRRWQSALLRLHEQLAGGG